MFLKLNHITTGYTEPLTTNISASLQEGEVGLLMGNNGVGKTTLIKTLLGQISPLAGDIQLAGKSLSEYNVADIARIIAVVFSKAALPANYTVTDLVSLGKYIHYPYYFELSSADQAEVQEIIGQLNLSDYRNYPLTQLSDGNLQKALIGRALVQGSPFLLLDEPTTHLDEENKLIILKLLRSLAKEQRKTILFSSHDWRLSKEFADQLWVLQSAGLDSGVTEDVLLRHPDLLSSQLFTVNSNFRAPQITAPPLQKEMLFSYLQKNTDANLSDWQFSWNGNFWLLIQGNMRQKAHSFKDIGVFLTNLG